MKRTFLFGLLGAFAAFIFITAVDLVLFAIGAGYDFVRLKDEQWIYDYAGDINFMWSFLTIFIIIWVFLCWKFGFITEKLSFWKEKPIRLKRVIVKMFIICLVGFLAWHLQAKNLFMPMDLSTYAINSFGDAYGQLIYFFTMFSPQIPLAFSVFSLWYIIATFSDKKDLWKNIIVPVSGIAFLCLNIATIFFLRSTFDLDKNISDIPGLSKKPDQRLLAVLDGDNPIFKMEEFYDDFDCSPLKKNFVAFNDNNADTIRNYIKENRMSALRASGYYYLIRKSEQELNIKQEASFNLEAFKITNSTSFMIFLLNRLNVANTEPYFHKMLIEASDERLYSIKGRPALKVSRIYAKYGELDKAEYWYKKASETALISNENERKSFAEGKPPKVSPFNVGKIMGTLKGNYMPMNNIGVGLISSSNLKNLLEFQKSNNAWAKYISFINLRGGTATGKDGRFSFDGLGEGEYILLLSIKNHDNKTVKVLNSPGTITISKDKPISDVGIIRLEY